MMFFLLVLFAREVGLLVGEGWQTQAINAYEGLFSSIEWKMEFKEWMHRVQLQVVHEFVLQNREEFIFGWQQLHLDPKHYTFDVTFTIWLIQRKDIGLG
jgi:hypothetical protein